MIDMRKPTMEAMIALAVLVSSSGAFADQAAEAKAEEIAHETETPVGEGGGEDEKYTVVTGLGFSMWWMKDLSLVGPGLGVGFVLVPDHFEMTLSLGAMLGSHVYSVPIELSFEVPFRVAKALNLYVNLGPTLLIDKADGETTHDWALSMGGGLEALPPGFDWGVFLEGDFNLRLQQEVRGQGGFSAGFRYRF